MAPGMAARLESSSQLAGLIRNAVEGTVVVDGDGVVLFANPAAETLLGMAPGGAAGFLLGYPVVGDEATVVTVRRPGSSDATVQLRGAETSWDGEPAFVVNLHDITNRLRADRETQRLQERTDHLNRVLRAIAGVNQVIIRESDPGRLIRETCDRLVSDGGFQASWLVLTNEDGSLSDAAESKLAGESFAALTEAFAQGEVPHCCLRALRKREVVRFAHGDDCEACELCSALEPTSSALTTCLVHGDRVFGYVTVLFESPIQDDGEETRLLHTIAGDLGFALHSIEEARGASRTRRLLEETERVADVGGWEWDLATDTFTVSDQWRRIHGVGPDPIHLSDVVAMSVPEDRERWASKLESLRDGHEPIEADHRIVTEDTGETRIVRSRSGSAEEGPGGRRTVRGIAQDITAAQEATEQIRFQARVLASVGEAVAVTDPEGTILFWNDAARELYGWSAEEAVGRSIVEVTPSPEMADAAREIMERLAAGETWSGEFEVRDRDGREFPALVTDAPVFGDDGTLEAIIGVSSDLTRLREAEESRRKAEAQLQQSQKMESIGMLAGGVAHDFNNVLGVILGIAELSLLSEDMPEPLRADFQEIHQAGTRAATLTRQLLAFARKQTIRPQVVDLNETVAGMIKMLGRLIGEDLELTWKPAHELWPVKVDPAQVDQILANLAVNARDAIQSGGAREGRITLTTAKVAIDRAFSKDYPDARPGEYVVLSVTDNGEGMDEVTLGKVFEPFFTTKAPGEGTGLGLATVYGITKQNGGFVSASSQIGEGTTIRVYLPRLLGAEAELEARSEAPDRGQRTETLLVVEDDPAVLRVVARILEQQGYNVLLAETPEAALELVRGGEATIDLLMTDVVMPDMNGRELADAVLALRPEIECLFVSGYTHDVIAQRGVLEEGMNFLEKPFTAESLDAALRQVLDDPARD